jgi:hypothetical protein
MHCAFRGLPAVLRTVQGLKAKTTPRRPQQRQNMLILPVSQVVCAHSYRIESILLRADCQAGRGIVLTTSAL